MELGQAPHQPAFQFCQYRTYAFFLLVQIQELLLYRLAQLAQIGSTHCVADGDQHVGSGFDQYAFVDGDAGFAVGFSLENQYPRYDRRDTIKPVRQQTERAFVCFRDNAQYAGLVGEHLEGKENLKIHAR